jgi:hypothetical protein
VPLRTVASSLLLPEEPTNRRKRKGKREGTLNPGKEILVPFEKIFENPCMDLPV